MTLPAPRPDEDDERPAAAPATLPPLPIEHHIVTATRALEAAKHKCELALALLQYAARDEAAVFGALNELQAATAAAGAAYVNYCEVLSCKGRA